MASRTAALPGDLFLLELRELSGAAGQHPLPGGGRQGQARIRTHIEWQRTGRGTHMAGYCRKLSAGRRLGDDSRGAAALYGRSGAHHTARGTMNKLLKSYFYWTYPRGCFHYD